MIFVDGTLTLEARTGNPPLLTGQPVYLRGRKEGDPVTVALTGFKLTFHNRGDLGFDDHLFGEAQVHLDLEPGPTAEFVTVTATLSLRDWTGDFEDRYAGVVSYVVISGQEAS